MNTKIIGIGGGGTNAVSHMYTKGLFPESLWVCDDDYREIMFSPVPNKFWLNSENGPNCPAQYMLEAYRERINSEFLEELVSEDKMDMMVLAAGLGSFTGGCLASVVSEMAKNRGIKVVAVVTMPFFFEGRKRREQAAIGLKELCQYADMVVVQELDGLRKSGDVKITKAFELADDRLTELVKLIMDKSDTIEAQPQGNPARIIRIAEVCDMELLAQSWQAAKSFTPHAQ